MRMRKHLTSEQLRVVEAIAHCGPMASEETLCRYMELARIKRELNSAACVADGLTYIVGHDDETTGRLAERVDVAIKELNARIDAIMYKL